ncbi:MAG: dihydroorotate dehydrogenase (quinone) [Flavobacteriales bacterium]|nr:dihydroorotate dehydrogenase (quinone) [Flavobacteriales bacterium]
MYTSIIKPFFFSKDPEKVHHMVFNMVKNLSKIPGFSAITRLFFQLKNKKLEREVFGLKFSNPVGLAAGFDKDAILFNELGDFGFGFIEIGTLTPKGQSGNDKPRLFRLPDDNALINRMGFNNQGVDAAIERLKHRKSNIIIGGNIGKNTATESANTDDDYIQVFEVLFDFVDYFVVNVSCPNVGNLTKLQEKEPLMQLMQKIAAINRSKSKPKPLLLKIAPDLSENELDDVVDIIKTLNLDGIVAANTSVNREGLGTPQKRLDEIGWPGGLSGKPLAERSTKVISYLYNQLGDKYPIIGVGGIHSEHDALEKINAGAKLIQLYTGFIYEGPGLVKRINKALVK